MNFPPGATRQFKIDACRAAGLSLPLADRGLRPLEHCSGPAPPVTSSRSTRTTGLRAPPIDATLLLDLSDAFDDNGTPTDYSDDKPRGTPLPCARRASSTVAEPWATSAFVEDCVVGEGGQSLRVADVAADEPAPGARGRREARRDPPHGVREPAASNNANPPFTRDRGHLRLARGGADAVRPLHARDRRARRRRPPDRRELLAGRRQPARQRRHPRVPGRTSSALRCREPTRRGDRRGEGLPGGGLREELGGRPRDLPHADPDRSRRGRSAPRTSSSRSRARTGSSWRGTRRARRSSTSPRTRTARSTSSARATSSRRTRTSGSRTSSRSSATLTAASLTGAPPATSPSVTPAATRSTSTRRRCRRRPSRGRSRASRCPARRRSRARPPRASRAPACASAAGFDFIKAKPRAKRKRVRFSFGTSTENRGKATVFRQATRRRVARRKVKTFRNRERGFTWAPRRATERLLRRALGDKAAERPQGHSPCRVAPPERALLRPAELRPAARRARSGRVPLARPLGLRRAQAQAAGRPVQARGGRRRRDRGRRAAARWSAGSRRRATRAGKSRVQIRLGRKAKRGAVPGHAQGQRARPRQRADAVARATCSVAPTGELRDAAVRGRRPDRDDHAEPAREPEHDRAADARRAPGRGAARGRRPGGARDRPARRGPRILRRASTSAAASTTGTSASRRRGSGTPARTSP